MKHTEDDINYVEDEDFFHFNAKEDKYYFVNVEILGGIDPIVEVWPEGQDDGPTAPIRLQSIRSDAKKFISNPRWRDKIQHQNF